METIIEAAIKINGVVYTGRRHSDIIAAVFRETKKRVSGEQGFLTSENRFVDRIEAAKIALAANQIQKLKWPPNLYSEDLY